MAQSLNLYLNVAHIFGIGTSALSADEATAASGRVGQIAFVNDAFGFRVFRYGKTGQSGGMSKGELSTRLADVTGTVTAAAGELNNTTHLSDTGNFTASAEIGKLCVITDDAGAAGAAPEGEVGVVTANSVDTLTLDSNYALSTAPAVGDTYANFSYFHHDDAADGDLAVNVMGIVMADRTAAYYGWLQIYGLNPGTIYTTDAVTAGNPVVAAAAAVDAHGCDTEQLWVGYAPIAVQADLASPFRTLCFIDVWHMAQPIA